jgi:hypothetical protein
MNVNNLASVLQCQDEYEAAEAMNRQALDGREKSTRIENPGPRTNITNLAF